MPETLWMLYCRTSPDGQGTGKTVINKSILQTTDLNIFNQACAAKEGIYQIGFCKLKLEFLYIKKLKMLKNIRYFSEVNIILK